MHARLSNRRWLQVLAPLLALVIAAPSHGVVDPEGTLARTRAKVDDTIVQLEDTILQLDDAILQVQLAQALDDLCAGCEAEADVLLARSQGKLVDTRQQLDDTRLQLRVARTIIDEAIAILQSGEPPTAIDPQLSEIDGLLTRGLDKLARARSKLAEAEDQINAADALLDACGICAAEAQAQIDRAIGQIQRAIAKVDLAIETVQAAIEQVEAIITRNNCPADTNGDGVVDVADLVAVILDWNTDGSGHNGDVNNDGIVDVTDLVGVILAWGACPGTAPVPVIVDAANPPGGASGDTIQIFGSGFDPNPDNNCAVVMMGPLQNCALPLHVIGASPDGTILTARIGPVWEGATPGPVMVGRGIGVRDFFVPNLPDLSVEQPVWVWQREPVGAPAGTGDFPFDPVPPPPPNPWFHGEPTPEGELCLYLPLTFNWQPDQKVEISLHAHNHATGVGVDVHIPCVIFLGPNIDPLECVNRICDSIQCAVDQLAGVGILNCFPSITPDGFKITISIKAADGQLLPIDWGGIDVCPVPPPVPVVINDFLPPVVATGDLVEIFGSGFDPNPDNNCVIIMNGEHAIPMMAEAVMDAGGGEQILHARVGPVRPDAVPGPIMIATGHGGHGVFVPAFPDILIEEPVWIWDRDPPGGPEGGSGTPIDPTPPPVPSWIHGDIVDGVLCLVIPPDVVWAPDQKLALTVRAHNHGAGIGHDGLFPCMVIEGDPGSPIACADRICDMIQCAFFQQSGLFINCFIEDLGPDVGVKITIILKGSDGQPLPIDWGNFELCLVPPPGDDCPWDLNGDGVVNDADVGIFQSLVGPCPPPPGSPCPGDFNGDGFVDAADLPQLLNAFGDCP